MEKTNESEVTRTHARELMEPQGAPPPAAQPEPESQHEADALELAAQVEAGAKDGSAQSIRELIVNTPGIRNLVIATAIRCLAAKRVMGSGQKDKPPVTVDDGATQMKAAVFLAGYADGLPAQTVVNWNVGGAKEMPIEEMLLRSPALVEAMEKQISRVKRVQKSGVAKTLEAPSVDGAPA